MLINIVILYKKLLISNTFIVHFKAASYHFQRPKTILELCI